MGAVILTEIATTSPAGEAGVLRFGDRAVRPFPPDDADRPNVGFDSRVLESFSLRRVLFEDIANLTPSLGVGVLNLANADRGLDAYEGHAWGEATVRVWQEGTPFADAVTVLRGVCGVPAYPRSTAQPGRTSVGLYDYRTELSKPVQTTVYAGSNDGETIFYEGEADGLKGQPKPLAWGDLTDAHVPAPCVNPGVLAYQLHGGAIEGGEAIYNSGAPAGYDAEGDYAGGAFDGAEPAPAGYRTDLGRGLLKMNGAPVGQVTFGFKGDKAGGVYVETPGPVIARLLARAGVPAERIGASVTALDCDRVVGLYAGDQLDAEQALQQLQAAVPAAVLPDRDGVWQAVPFGPPAEIADIAIAAHQVIALTADETAPLPAGVVRVGWGRIYRTFSGADLHPSLVGTADQERLATEYRWAVAEDAVTKARHPSTWRTVEIPTALRREADAQALAGELKALFALRPDGRPRRMWKVTVERDLALAMQLGWTVALSFPPQGVDGDFLLVGEEPFRPRRDQAVLTVWG